MPPSPGIVAQAGFNYPPLFIQGRRYRDELVALGHHLLAQSRAVHHGISDAVAGRPQRVGYAEGGVEVAMTWRQHENDLNARE